MIISLNHIELIDIEPGDTLLLRLSSGYEKRVEYFSKQELETDLEILHEAMYSTLEFIALRNGRFFTFKTLENII